jgi:hypothetical protein
MSAAEVAHSRPASANGDSTVAPTPDVNLKEKNGAQDVTVAPESNEEDVAEKGGPPKSAVNESDLLTGKTLVVVWTAFLLLVSFRDLWQSSLI